MAVYGLALRVKFHQSLRHGTKLHYCQFFSLWPLLSTENRGGERKLGEIPRDDNLSAMEHWRRGRRAERTTLFPTTPSQHSKRNSCGLGRCGRIEQNFSRTVSACTQYKVLSADFQRPKAWQEIKKRFLKTRGQTVEQREFLNFRKNWLQGIKYRELSHSLEKKCSVMRNKNSLGKSFVPRLNTLWSSVPILPS